MKRIVAILILLLLLPSSSLAGGWWNDWRGDDRYEREDPVEDAYEEGYEDGFDDGTEDPFYYDDDKAGAFGYWFLNQEWTSDELYAWKAVFDAMFDNKNRTNIEYKEEYKFPVYVAIITGTVFHKEEKCSRLTPAYAVEKLELEDAIQRGFKPCKTCSEK